MVTGFFLFLAFISFMFSAMTDPIVKPTVAKGVDLSDGWNAREPGSLFEDSDSTFGCGASPASCGVAAELQVSSLAGVGEPYTDII